MPGPGLRLVGVPAVLLLAALVAYALPPRATRRALAVTLGGVLAAAALLASVLPLVGGDGRVERTLPDLVGGVPLAVRGDSTGVVLSLIASAAALVSLLGPARRSLERAGLLLCLAGTTTVCLAANAVLVFGGLELGNVGALLLTAAATSDPGLLRRAKLVFGIEHVAALGLLAAAVELRVGVGTSDLAAIPDGAVTALVGLPWACAGIARLAAVGALPGTAGTRPSSAWTAVAALPGGLAVLLRLGDAEGSGGAPLAVSGLLVAAGLALAGGGALGSLRDHRRPAAAGRWLLLAGAGQVVVAFGGGSAALGAAALLWLGLLVAALTAPAWGAGGEEGSGSAAAWARALALAGAAGLPVGAATAGLLAVLGAEAAPGPARSLIALAAGLAALGAALGGSLAARDALDAAPAGNRAGPRRDAALGLAAAAAFALLPGVLGGAIAEHLGPGELVAVDSGAVRGPGGGWPGGYLAVAALGGLLVAWALSVLLGTAWRGRPAAAAPVVRATVPLLGVPGALRRLGTLAGRADAWLVDQPDISVVLLAAVACLAWFGLRR